MEGIYKDVGSELAKELLAPTADVSIDYLELSLDSILSDSVLSEVPIIKTITALCKTGLAIRERFFTKKLLVFLSEYHRGSVTDEETRKFIKDMENREHKSKVVDTLIIYIDKYTECEKARMLAKLLINYIRGRYDWMKFVFYANCVESMFIRDIEPLKIFYSNRNSLIERISDLIIPYYSAINRLEYLGFISSMSYNRFTWRQAQVNVCYKISQDGLEFYEAIKGD